MKGVIFFLLRFIGTYLVLSVAYGLFIYHYDTLDPPMTDPITRFVSEQTRNTFEFFGYKAETVHDHHRLFEAEEEQTYDSLFLNDHYAVSIEEGCNGVSVAILFLAFVIGFGGKWKAMSWFLPFGLLTIHVSNITRLMVLSILNVDFDGAAFHFFHKYGFTAMIYGTVFLLWVWWVNRYGRLRSSTQTTSNLPTDEDA